MLNAQRIINISSLKLTNIIAFVILKITVPFIRLSASLSRGTDFAFKSSKSFL